MIKGTRGIAEKYLRFLYTEEGQETIAKHFYRPIDEAVLARHSAAFPKIEFFAIRSIASGWDEAQQKLFADGGVFDRDLPSQRNAFGVSPGQVTSNSRAAVTGGSGARDSSDTGGVPM